MSSNSLTTALQETLALFDGSCAPLTTIEAADRLDIGRRSTYERLERLAERGEIETKVAGANGRIWWRPLPGTDDRLEASREDRPIILESLVDVLDGAEVGVFVLDDTFDVAWVNEATERYFGLDREQVIGRDKRTLIEEEIAAIIEDADHFSDTVLATYENNTYIERFECRVTTGDGREERWLEHRSKPIGSGHYSGGRIEYYYDLTEQHRSDQALHETEHQVQSQVDTVEEYAVFVLDSEGQVQTWNEGAREIKGYSEDKILGEHVSRLYTEEDCESGVPEKNLDTADAEGSIDVEGWWVRADGSTIWGHGTITAIHDEDGHLDGFVIVVRDLSHRREREQTLLTATNVAQRERQDELLHRQHDGGEGDLEQVIDRVDDIVYGLDNEWRFTYLNEQAGAVLGRDVGDLRGREIWEMFPEAKDNPIHEVFEMAMETQEPTRMERYSGLLEMWMELRVYPSESGLSVYFTDIDERKKAEQELEAQRQHLVALNNLNEVVREITDAVIDRSSREEIEEVVCERLAASESYSFAWIGEVDVWSDTVNLRTEAGVSGYLDDITISVDPDDERSQGPTGRAFIEREIQFVQDVDHDSSHDPWRDHVRDHQFRSSAAIPIAHEGTLYGVLNVYALRPNGFAENERTVIGQLGEVIGHAIAAIERQRALTSDELLELEVQLGDFFRGIDVPLDPEGAITLDRGVPAGHGNFLEYGTATEDTMDVVEHLVESETFPHWESVDVIRRDGNTVHFEAKLVDPPVLSTVTAYGGYIDVARIENGNCYMRIHLPPGANVRLVRDSIKEAYPGMQLVAHHQIDRNQESARGLRSTFYETLTERQRAALEAGYFAGYFEWPRDTKGEEVAESLAVSPATYHQHLRNGQRKLLEAVFEG